MSRGGGLPPDPGWQPPAEEAWKGEPEAPEVVEGMPPEWSGWRRFYVLAWFRVLRLLWFIRPKGLATVTIAEGQ